MKRKHADIGINSSLSGPPRYVPEKSKNQIDNRPLLQMVMFYSLVSISVKSKCNFLFFSQKTRIILFPNLITKTKLFPIGWGQALAVCLWIKWPIMFYSKSCLWTTRPLTSKSFFTVSLSPIVFDNLPLPPVIGLPSI